MCLGRLFYSFMLRERGYDLLAELATVCKLIVEVHIEIEYRINIAALSLM